jgi:hypothetical protein
MAAILIGDRRLAAYRLKSDHAELAEYRCVVGCSASGPDNAPHTILASRCVSVGLQRGARGVPVFARGKVIRPAAHGIRASQLATRVILQNESANAVTVRCENDFNRRHECYPFLFLPASAHIPSG